MRTNDPTPSPNHAGTRRGPLHPILAAFPGPILAKLYAYAVAWRNEGFDLGHGVVTIDRPVVSVGNLSVGGTGKTPMVMQLLAWLKDADRTPAVAMRGYRAPKGRPGESDEALEYQRVCPGVQLAVGKDRAFELRQMFTTRRGGAVDCVVLDDGFQHRSIARQLDLVLLDATRSPFEDRLMPVGWLREPVANLTRATHVVITHAETAGPDRVAHLARRVENLLGRPPAAVCRHTWAALVMGWDATTERTVPPTWLAGKRIALACAIGNPDPFLAHAATLIGAQPAARLVLRDHDPFAPSTVDRLVALAKDARADAILVTSKDWSKLAAVARDRWPCPVLRPRLVLKFDTGGEALQRAVLDAVRTFRPPRPEPRHPDARTIITP